ncbi:hypothetical protein [Prescottella subtropica]|uniref:hypothetical protein n=1 Tax=Prescottella subtropica TaxID=2545757 RepID=UPI0010F5CF3B|nr:hypothetical protein [Prescottella subtropica]
MRAGEHPQRTPLYGVLMIIVALAASTAVTYSGPSWLRVTVYITTVAVVAVGFVMTFRDFSH